MVRKTPKTNAQTPLRARKWIGMAAVLAREILILMD
jgi:hypothetical protein